MEKPSYEIVFKNYEEDTLKITQAQAVNLIELLATDNFVTVGDELIAASTIARIRPIKEVIF